MMLNVCKQEVVRAVCQLVSIKSSTRLDESTKKEKKENGFSVQLTDENGAAAPGSGVIACYLSNTVLTQLI